MKHSTLFFALLFSVPAFAQTKVEPTWLKKGEMQVGLTAGIGVGNSLGGYVRATPYAQYFLKNNWALRLEGRYNTNGFGANPDQYVGAGLSTQYHFIQKGKFSIYGQLGYFYGQTTQGMYRYAWQSPAPETNILERYPARVKYGMVNVGLGAHYQLSSRWYINALGESNIEGKSTNVPVDHYNVNVGVGFRIK